MHVLAATTYGNSGAGYWIFELILGLIFAFVGYRASERFRQQWGRTPWGWPSVVWGVVCFISILLGVILMLIARRGTRRKIQAGGYGTPYGGYPGAVPPGMPPPYQQPSQGWGQPPTGQSWGQPGASQGWQQPSQTWGEPPAQAAPPPGAPSNPAAQPNWYPDPAGKHQYRYFDGTRWTDDVSDNGVALKDPLPG